MLIIHDKKNRKSGVKDYLENGTNNDRNKKDKRVHLYGDIDILDEAIKLGNAMNYKESYKNFVLSFEEDFIHDRTLATITKDFINQYTSGYEAKEFVAYAEAHKPKIKYKKDTKTGKLLKRHLHIHISIATYSPHLEKRLELGHHGGRMTEFNLWKKYVEKTFKLKSVTANPIKSENPNIAPSFFNQKENREMLNDITIREAMKLKNLDELIKIFEQYSFVKSIKKSSDKALSPYIAITLAHSNKTVRLKGGLYSDKTFNSAVQELKNKDKDIYREASNPLEIEKPKKLVKFTDKRIKKVYDRELKARVKAKEREEPIQLSEQEYKSWIKSLEYKKTTHVKSTYQKTKNRLNQQIVSLMDKSDELIEFNTLDMKNIKKQLDGQILLNELKRTHKLNIDLYYSWLHQNGEQRIKVGNHNLNIADFLTKEMNIKWHEAKNYLEIIYKKQLKNNQKPLLVVQNNVINKISYQNKIFIDIYKVSSNIDLRSFYIEYKENKTILTSKSQGIKIIDYGNNIVSDDGYDLKEQVSLMLDIAKAKEWDLLNLDISGSEEFKEESYKQIEVLLLRDNLEVDIVQHNGTSKRLKK